MKRHRISLRAISRNLVFATLLGFASCGGDGDSNSASAATADLFADPLSITSGETTTLTWTSTNATDCVGTGFTTGGATSGSVDASPTTNTTYILTCTAEEGSVTATTSVTVIESTQIEWTISANFNEGTLGSAAGGDEGFQGAFASTITDEQFYSGDYAAKLMANKGSGNWGVFGGIFSFPEDLVKGNEIWIRVRTYFPSDFDYTANPRLKFMRTHVQKPDGSGDWTNGGYNDWYINPPGSEVPFGVIKESHNVWSFFGDSGDGIVQDMWETYEMYIKFDDVSLDEGGQGRMLSWKNGELLNDFQGVQTLNTFDSYSGKFYLFTYWNSDPYTSAIDYSSISGEFVEGEEVIGNTVTHPYELQEIRPNNDFVIYNPLRGESGGKPSFPSAEILTGQTSDATLVVNSNFEQYPTQTQYMYVDDIVITTATPDAVDSAGNPMIGI